MAHPEGMEDDDVDDFLHEYIHPIRPIIFAYETSQFIA
jgi:hypothetical protein